MNSASSLRTQKRRKYFFCMIFHINFSSKEWVCFRAILLNFIYIAVQKLFWNIPITRQQDLINNDNIFQYFRQLIPWVNGVPKSVFVFQTSPLMLKRITAQYIHFVSLKIINRIEIQETYKYNISLILFCYFS